MELPLGLKKPHRILELLPPGLMALLILGALGLAIAHLATKQPAPQLDASTAQIAAGQTTPYRGPYNLDDFREPKSK